MKKLFPILLILATIFNTQSLKAGASFSINDSTFQEVIEFTHPNKKLKKDLFFKVGDEVIIKTKYSPKLIKAKIEYRFISNSNQIVTANMVNKWL